MVGRIERLERILTCVMLIALAQGCATKSVDEAQRIFRASSSSANERMDAVKALLSPGMEGPVVQRILGDGGVWIHWHGPSANLVTEQGITVMRPAADHDYWTLEFPMSGGAIALFFTAPPGSPQNQFRYERVAFRRHLPTER